MNKKLIILGKAPVKGKQCLDARVDFPDCEVWTVGTHKIEHADRYYEFHGLNVAGREMVRDVLSEVRAMGAFVPLNNSICVMLVQAYIEGYEDIEILGSPMIAKDEYIKQRAALAMCIGYIRGATHERVHIKWPDEPEYIDYFKRYQ
jgi:hypothetical protein